MFSKNNSRFKKTLVIVCVCLLCTTLFAATASANSKVDILGFLRDDDTGSPVYNARVDLFYDQDSIPFISVFSDINGRIVQPVYASRTVKRVEITRAGYKKAVYTIPSYTHTIDLGVKYLVAGSTREDIYKVYGTVLDDRDGAYIPDARVILTDEYDGITYVCYTDARGYFAVVNLPLSDYAVSVTKYGYRDYTMKNLLRLRTGDYNLGTVRLGKTGTPVSSVKTLTGRITDEDGYFVQGAEVYLLDSSGEETKTRTDARGYYTFQDLAAQTYTIGVNAAGYELLERIDYVRIVSTDVEKEVNLIVKTESRQGYDVYGRVVDENKEEVEGVEVSLIDGKTRIKKVLTDAMGYYEFRYVPDGRYNLEFKKPGYQTITLSREIRVEGSYYPVAQTELYMKKGSTTVIGGLVGDQQTGLNNVTACLEGGMNSYTARTNYYGYFTFTDVQEGTYNLYATIDNTKKLLETNVRVWGSRIDLGDINVNRLASGYRITGLVKDTDSYKISNVKITVTAEGIKKETFTDSGGSYSLEGLGRGNYTVTAAKEGYGAAVEKINISSYDLQQNFTLRPNDYIKVDSATISLAVNEMIALDRFISQVAIYSSRGVLLDTITSHYEVSVPAEYAAYLTANANNEIKGKKTGEAYLEITIRNSRDYDHLSPALLKVTITEPVLAREAMLIIGTNKYTLGGKTKTADAVPYLKEGRSFFPLRVMAEVLGVTDENIKWDPATRTATLVKDDHTVAVTVGQKYYLHNGETLPMDVQAENVEGRIYLPARYVTEALGGEIEWNGTTKTLLIRSY